MALGPKLPALLAGEAEPADADEALVLAQLCVETKRLTVAAARFYRRAFEADPKPAASLVAVHRYNGACAAALAGCGLGKDAATLDAAERAGWRKQALAWLTADLRLHADRLAAGKAPPAVVVSTLSHWQTDRDLAGVRGEAALAKRPAGERPGWQALWGDVERTLRQAQAMEKAAQPTAHGPPAGGQ